MKISDLSRETGLPVATIKYYLRENVLPGGVTLSRTQAAYGPEHVARIRLIRALTDLGGLSMAGVRAVISALDDPPPARHDLLGVAQRALTEASGASVEPGAESELRIREWLDRRGWAIDPGDPLIPLLAAQLGHAAAAGVELGNDLLDRYADAMTVVAEADVDSVPADPAGALRRVVLGTALVDPVLITLRRLAQHAVSERRPGK
jgi:DNA-binding transcriptional MerR regulator